MQPKKLLDNSGSGGIIKEAGRKKPVTRITNNVINNVPQVKIQGYSGEQCEYIQSQHKELLRYARDNNDNNEVAFVFNSDLSKRYEFMGTDESLDFENGLFGKGNELFIMHNHPRSGGFSDVDIANFISNNQIKSFSLVKHNGNVEIISKTDIFDKEKAITEYKRQYKRYVKNYNEKEIEKAIFEFLKKYSGGLEWIKS